MITPKTRKLRCEPLEDRRMLSITLHVDDSSTAVVPDGLAWDTAYVDLQSALTEAATRNADTDSTNDVDAIWIAAGTYHPTAELEPGDPRSASFSLVDNVSLYGGFAGFETSLTERNLSAAHTTTLSGDIGAINDNSDNAYTVVYCGESITTTLDGLLVVAGNANGDSDFSHLGAGGGIYNSGLLTLSNTKVSDNSARFGGGIYCNGYNRTTTLTITNSALTGNSANCTKGTSRGGGIYSYYCTVTITNSTISGNSAEYGGGINSGSGELTVTNSTLSGNSAMRSGGGIISSVTILNNTIIAGNKAPSYQDISYSSASTSGFHNLIGDGSGQNALINGINGNLVGTSSSPIDPKLSDLTQFNNGQWGHYLLSGSPAIDAGDNNLALDTAGILLSEDVCGNPRIENSVVDIGATEGSTSINNPAQIYLVTSLERTIADDGVLTFTEAFEATQRNQPIGDAQAGSYTQQDIIQFADNVSGTILVNDGMLVIVGDLQIQGPGDELLTFGAANQNRVFSVQPGISVVLSGITINGGKAFYGGGISNSGTLSLSNCTLSGSSAHTGGGIHNNCGVLTVKNSTISKNSAYNGGGISNEIGVLNVMNCTFSENSATSDNDGSGGGIYNYYGTLTATNCSLSKNSAYNGGGIYNVGSFSVATLNNTIVAGSMTRHPWLDIYYPSADIYFDSGALTGSHNLIGNGSGLSSFVDGVNGNLVGTSESPIDPGFVDPDNGNYRLAAGSSAIDAGDNGLVPSGVITDLDGNYRIAGGTVDIGAYEFGAGPVVAGDANCDGRVDGSDVTILAGNWQAGVPEGDPLNVTWRRGDFNGDGKVDGSDVTILAANWQIGVNTTTVATSAEPEEESARQFIPPENNALGVATVRRRETLPPKRFITPKPEAADAVLADSSWSGTELAAIARDITVASAKKTNVSGGAWPRVF